MPEPWTSNPTPVRNLLRDLSASRLETLARKCGDVPVDLRDHSEFIAVQVEHSPLQLVTVLRKFQLNEVHEVCSRLAIPTTARKEILVRRIMEELKLKPTRVFISYSHDDKEHSARVLRLANRLRADGIDAYLDQYEPVPEQGWFRWMQKQMESADYVLLVASEIYRKRFEGKAEGPAGWGAGFEGALATQLRFGPERGKQRFVPVALTDADLRYVPLAMKDLSTFVVSEDYEGLRAALSRGRGRGTPLPASSAHSVGAVAPVRVGRLDLVLDLDVREARIRLDEIRRALRDVGGETIDITDVQAGSTQLTIVGSPEEIEKLRQKIDDGELQEIVGSSIRVADAAPKPSKGPPWFSRAKLSRLAKLAEDAGADNLRDKILDGLPKGVWRQLMNGKSSTRDDLLKLNDMHRLRDGDVPLEQWIWLLRYQVGTDFDLSEIHNLHCELCDILGVVHPDP